MSDPVPRPRTAQVSFVVLFLLIIFVVLIRAPSDAPPPMNAAQGDATEAPAGRDGVDRDSAQPAPGGSVLLPPAETIEPPLAPGCIRSGTSRAEVRAIMGAPDSVGYGNWVYGRSWVAFGYGQVNDFENVDGSLRLCP